jgi:L,D-peptidoglycan transpeptidase YkuD (ErfK/YbiS/YcfS/YnhG family)
MRTHTTSPQMVRQLVVRGLSAGARRGILTCGNLQFPCALGRSGRRAEKREGDGATPIGSFALRGALYRADRLARPRTLLPLRTIHASDGWCDEPGDRNYNRAVRHPYCASAERLWRDDPLYDLVVILGHNDLPRARGRGSAVFMHVAGPGLAPTAGCIALRLPHLLRLIEQITRDTIVRITA